MLSSVPTVVTGIQFPSDTAGQPSSAAAGTLFVVDWHECRSVFYTTLIFKCYIIKKLYIIIAYISAVNSWYVCVIH